MKADVVIIGGGVIGVACAYYLRKAGLEVCLLDKGKVGAGASHANCGLVTPSHALPLTMPGVILKSLKWMAKADSPFYIKPELDLEKLLWLLQFAKRCNEQDMIGAMHGRRALLDSSRKLFTQLFDDEDLPCEWQTVGTLFVFKESKGMHAYEGTNKLLAEYGLGAKPYTGKELQRLEPALLDTVYGAWHYEMDAHLKPDCLMRAWAERIKEMGVHMVEDCKVQTISGDVVHSTQGEYRGSKIVLATGAWSSPFGKQLGLKLPVQPGKGYSLTMNQPTDPVKMPCLFQEVKMVATPFHSGYRLGGTMEFAGFDTTLNQTRIEAIRKSAAQYMRTPEGDTLTETWFGWRPMTWDGLPIIDQSPIDPNLYFALGHNMLGLSMAPSTGKLIAEILTGMTPHIDPTPYAYRRKIGSTLKTWRKA